MMTKKSTNNCKTAVLIHNNEQNETKKIGHTIEETKLKDVANDDILTNSSQNKIND